MADLVVKLYDLPDHRPWLERLQKEGLTIRRALSCDKHIVVEWVRKTFGKLWASECDVAFAGRPISCYIATKEGQIVGFSCYDSSMKNFFGPVGVAEQARGRGIGTALLFKCLRAMASAGYAYAIVGDAGSPEFYEKTVNARVIPGSSPGIYFDRLK